MFKLKMSYWIVMARSVLNRKRRDKLEEKEGEIGKIRYS
jgi:hypothetical protein